LGFRSFGRCVPARRTAITTATTLAAFAGAYALDLPLVAALFAGIFVFFQHLNRAYTAALGRAGFATAARATSVAAITALVAFLPRALKAKAGNADLLALHFPAVFFHFFGYTHRTTHRPAACGFARATRISATCKCHIFIMLHNLCRSKWDRTSALRTL